MSESDDAYGGDELLSEIATKAMELSVNVGLFNSVSPHWPEHVQENWRQRMGEVRADLQKHIDEIQQFAEAFD